MTPLHIAVLPGDGIGPEVIAASLDVLRATNAPGPSRPMNHPLAHALLRILTKDLARHALPMDLPAREADPTQKILPQR